MALIVSWAYTVSGVREALYTQDQFLVWLRRLVLEEPEPCVRREVCMALYRSVQYLTYTLLILHWWIEALLNMYALSTR